MDTTRLLVEHGASLSVQNQDGDTALHIAASHHMGDVVRYLLGAGASPNAVNNGRAPPLPTFGHAHAEHPASHPKPLY